jgi:hypothetical protein
MARHGMQVGVQKPRRTARTNSMTRGLARAIFCKAEVVQRMEHKERCQVSCPVSCNIPSMGVRTLS